MSAAHEGKFRQKYCRQANLGKLLTGNDLMIIIHPVSGNDCGEVLFSKSTHTVLCTMQPWVQGWQGHSYFMYDIMYGTSCCWPITPPLSVCSPRDGQPA